MSLPKVYEELNTPTNKLKKSIKEICKILKVVLFITIIILTFKISEKSSEYILNLSFEELSKIINVILVLLVALIYKRK